MRKHQDITRKTDLREGRPVWAGAGRDVAKSFGLTVNDPPQRDIRCDVVVVGAGISGAMAAAELVDCGLSVVMIDRRGVLLGSTPASTALVQYDIDVPITKLVRMIGLEKAQRAWQRARLGLDSLTGRMHELGIYASAQTTVQDVLYLSGNVLNVGGLKNEIAHRRAAGLHAGFVGRQELAEKYGIIGAGAVRHHGNLAPDPVRLAAGFLRHAVDRGMRIYAPCEAAEINDHPRGIDIQLRGGATIKARHAVFATGYEFLKPLRSTRHSISSTYVIATVPQDKAVVDGMPMIWEASDPYLYLRRTRDGRIVCGGEDDDISDPDVRDARLPRKAERLAAKLKKLMPAVDARYDHVWAGSFGTSTTGLPLIGAAPAYRNCYVIMGFGGNGIVFSRIASEIVTSMISGKDDCDADLFTPV